jgi:hypothetical protein
MCDIIPAIQIVYEIVQNIDVKLYLFKSFFLKNTQKT